MLSLWQFFLYAVVVDITWFYALSLAVCFHVVFVLSLFWHNLILCSRVGSFFLLLLLLFDVVDVTWFCVFALAVCFVCCCCCLLLLLLLLLFVVNDVIWFFCGVGSFCMLLLLLFVVIVVDVTWFCVFALAVCCCCCCCCYCCWRYLILYFRVGSLFCMLLLLLLLLLLFVVIVVNVTWFCVLALAVCFVYPSSFCPKRGRRCPVRCWQKHSCRRFWRLVASQGEGSDHSGSPCFRRVWLLHYQWQQW